MIGFHGGVLKTPPLFQPKMDFWARLKFGCLNINVNGHPKLWNQPKPPKGLLQGPLKVWAEKNGGKSKYNVGLIACYDWNWIETLKIPHGLTLKFFYYDKKHLGGWKKHWIVTKTGTPTLKIHTGKKGDNSKICVNDGMENSNFIVRMGMTWDNSMTL